MIGSGPAGLAMLRALSKLKHGAVDFACYDRQPAAGGMWTGDRRFSPMLVIITVIYLMDFGFPFYFPSSTHAGALMGTWRLFTGTMGCGLTVPLTIRNTRRKCILLIFMASLFDG